MLICAILSTAISTGTKNCVFVLRQYKLADAPVAGQFQSQKMLPRITINPRRVSFSYYVDVIEAPNAYDRLAGLEFTLHNGLPQEKLTALRQCVEKIGINKPAAEITLAIRTVPMGNLQAIQELRISV